MIDQTVIDCVAAAIESADIGYSMRQIRLVDGINTYAVSIEGMPTEEFTDSDDASASDQCYARIREVKQQRQAEAVIAALSSSHPAQNMLTEHDPNLNWGKKTYRMTFMSWKYQVTHEVTVGGNCLGMENLRAALSSLYEKLPVDQFDTPYLLMTDGDGVTLQNGDDLGECEDWLESILVSVALIKIEPEVQGRTGRLSSEGEAT